MDTTLTSREFNQDTGRAKRAAEAGPVIITSRGRPTHVLLTVEAYQRLKGPKKTLAERLYYPGAAEAELPLPERRIEPERKIDWGAPRFFAFQGRFGSLKPSRSGLA